MIKDDIPSLNIYILGMDCLTLYCLENGQISINWPWQECDRHVQLSNTFQSSSYPCWPTLQRSMSVQISQFDSHLSVKLFSHPFARFPPPSQPSTIFANRSDLHNWSWMQSISNMSRLSATRETMFVVLRLVTLVLNALQNFYRLRDINFSMIPPNWLRLAGGRWMIKVQARHKIFRQQYESWWVKRIFTTGASTAFHSSMAAEGEEKWNRKQNLKIILMPVACKYPD